jgi:acyl-coenzyme A synthetase/AMP-(fatty) acid ligase
MIKEFYTKLHGVFSQSTNNAYVYYGEKYSYAELYGRMKMINGRLDGRWQKRIAVYAEKSIGAYAAIYSIILSGNIWVPFTPGYPVKRLIEMLAVLDAEAIIYDEEMPPELADHVRQKGISLWSLDEILKSGKTKEFTDLPAKEDESAYIMFTSGSTGTPKGVPMTHLNYINFVRNAMEILPFRKGEVFSDYHDFAFDISIFYLFCAPLSESALSPIRKEEERIFPVKHFQENRITVWSSVPSVIARIQRLRPNEKIANDFSILFICGEPFSLNVLKYCYENLGAENVFDFYGLTETGVENFYHKCSYEDLKKYKDKGFVPIGKPLKGNDINVTDEKELLLAGCQITPGYLKGIEASRFETVEGRRWYHTGDIVERSGEVYFCKGRLDSQVKLSGYRVEMMDIEIHVREHPGIKEAVCFVDDSKNVKMLVCAYELVEGATVSTQDLKARLVNVLPEYMVPKKFIILDDMPRNNNGKLDRKKIKEIYLGDMAKALR